MVRRSLMLLAKRVPLIQFRKGGLANKGGAGNTGAPGQQSASQSSSAPAIEDWELPARFARKPIDPLEMEYINNGGIPN